MPSRAHIVTMGCAKNEADSAMMRGRLVQAGFEMEEDPDRADVLIVNTCSFIEAACEESIDAIFEALSLPHVSSGETPLIVAGCLPSRYGRDLEEELTEAAAFVPCASEEDIVDAVDRCLGIVRDDAASDEATGPDNPPSARMRGEVACESDAFPADGASAGSTFAYVKISEGCDRFCAYCTIPLIRGRYRSRSFDAILHDVEDRVASGAHEIDLVAQDTGRWGVDFDRQPATLAWLVDELAGRFPRTWFRTMYLQPDGVSDDLLAAMSSHDNVCPYLDIPLQHVVPSLLEAMNRTGGRTEFEALVARIRAALPGIALRTTLIAGFPGETDRDFDDLCDFVAQGDFDYVGVFPFFREEGTRAFDYPGQIEDDEREDRAQRLRDIADTACSQRISARCGSVLDVLVEGREPDGALFGRAMCQAPEVDGVTYVESGMIGDVVPVRIEDTFLYDMEGR